MRGSRLKRIRYAAVAFFVSAGLVLSGTAGALAKPSENGLKKRRVATLKQVAQQFADQDGYDNVVNLGFSAVGMTAKLRLWAMGAGGVSPKKAADDIEILAESANVFVNDGNDETAWEEHGSPALMEAALSFGYILHEWGGKLPKDVRNELLRAMRGDWGVVGPYLVNADLNILAGKLLAGEALGRNSGMWKKAVKDLREVFRQTTAAGALELNSASYTAYQLAALVPLMDLKSKGVRQKARTLLEYVLLAQGHLWLPGGGLGAPQTREYRGGVVDPRHGSLERVLKYLIGSPSYKPASTPHLIGAVTDYQAPKAIRSVFRNKGNGYTAWMSTHVPYADGSKSTWEASYDFVRGDNPVSPWSVVMMPGGDVMMGQAFGHRRMANHVSSGVYMRQPGTDKFRALYQYHPYTEDDLEDVYLPSYPADDNQNNKGPHDDFSGEFYDHERMVHGRTRLSLWDPTERFKKNVTPVKQSTRVHIPNMDAYGGKTVRRGKWFISRVNNTYVAYRPLGKKVVAEKRHCIDAPSHYDENKRATCDGKPDTYPTEHYFLKLKGASGGITELATIRQFDSIEAYAKNLKKRSKKLKFNTGNNYYVKFPALDPQSGKTVPVKLKYRPEKRFVNGKHISNREALDHGLMESPWVDHNEKKRTLRVARGCYDRITYDLKSGAITTSKPPKNCDKNGGNGGDGGDGGDGNDGGNGGDDGKNDGGNGNGGNNGGDGNNGDRNDGNRGDDGNGNGEPGDGSDDQKTGGASDNEKSEGALPFTGSPLATMAWIAFGLCTAGGLLFLVSRLRGRAAERS